MKTMARSMVWVGFLGLLLVAASQAVAASPTVVGQIQGFEVAAQGDGHGAIFVFTFSGTLNGKASKGTGWIEVFHDPLPTEVGDTAAITGGDGALWIGLRRLDIDVTGGVLELKEPGIFEVSAGLDIGNQRLGFSSEEYVGVLSHLTFPPTIGGAIAASP